MIPSEILANFTTSGTFVPPCSEEYAKDLCGICWREGVGAFDRLLNIARVEFFIIIFLLIIIICIWHKLWR